MIFFSSSPLLSPACLSSVLTRLQLGIRATRTGHEFVAWHGSTPWCVNNRGPNNTFGAPALLSTLRTNTPELAAQQGMGLEEGEREEGKERTERAKEKEERTTMVSSISPSSVAAFKQCPQLFYYRHVLGLRSPATRETLKGIAVHEVLSKFFELPMESRDLEHLHELFRGVMTKLIAEGKTDPRKGYSKLFETRLQEKKWAIECLDLLANFITSESQAVSVGDPCHVEFRMRHGFDATRTREDATADGKDEHMATTSVVTSTTPDSEGVRLVGSTQGHVPSMTVTGIIDRLDRCPDGSFRVVDYKTGKIPDLKYPEAVNRRIMDDNFFQLQMYALLVARVLGEVPGEMRIVFLKGPKSVTRTFDPSDLRTMEDKLRSIWDDIISAVQSSNFPARPGRLCGWCSFKDRCPAFNTGVEESKTRSTLADNS